MTTRYLVDRELGAGTFATVRKGWTRRELGPVALKVIKKLLSEAFSGSMVEEQRRSEIEVMARLEHPCVTRLLDHAESFRELVIVMEFCGGGELGSLLGSEGREGLTEQTAIFMFYQVPASPYSPPPHQVVQAVEYLHSRGVCHRDIKPGNILLVERSDRSLLKLADFGVSKLLSDSTVMNTLVGTPHYIAPEVIAAGRHPWDCYTVRSDCWSLGVLLYQLLSGEKPFRRMQDRPPVTVQIQQGHYDIRDPLWDGVSLEAKQLVAALLQVTLTMTTDKDQY